MRNGVIACFAVLLACGDDSRAGGEGIASDTEYIGEDIPAGNCGETENAACGTSSGGEPLPSTCQASQECAAGESCSAVFDGDIGAFACRASCIEDHDETRWCLDDDACCADGSTCQGRGYCIPSGRTSESGGADGDTTDTTSTGGISGAIPR